jgi:cysteinyl-tRNA synthetase
MLNLKHEKMSKSQGNFITVKDVAAKYPKELIRFYILSSHYRSELEYHDQKLEEVGRGWQRFNDCVNGLAKLIDEPQGEIGELSGDEAVLLDAVRTAEAKFIEAMNDDFNTAMAIGVLFELLHQVNSYIAKGNNSLEANYVLHEAYQLFSKLAGDILGIIRPDEVQISGLTQPLMELLLELRTELRSQKQYQLADYIRDELAKLNIVIEDTPNGPRWKIRS